MEANMNTQIPIKEFLAYGEIQGSYEAIECKSNHFHPNPQEFNFSNGFLTGLKYDSLEYIRRWCQHSKKLNFYTFPSNPSIWKNFLPEGLYNEIPVKVSRFLNKSHHIPKKNNILVWKINSSGYEHVAIITEVNLELEYIRIAEQNKHFYKWFGDYSRELKFLKNHENYEILDEYEVLGWIEILDEQRDDHIENVRKVSFNAKPLGDWIDMNDPAENLFSTDSVNLGISKDVLEYYAMTENFAAKVLAGSVELNYMSLKATKKVVDSDELLGKFMIPEVFWHMIRRSWEERTDYLAGRLDLAFNGKNVKMIEYNADSAGVFIESGLIMEKWAKATGCDVGIETCSGFHKSFVDFWKNYNKNSRVHVLIDNEDIEELYMGKYMCRILKEAGLDYFESIKNSGLSKLPDGTIVDSDNIPLTLVWKTWNWNTILNDYLTQPQDTEIVTLSNVFLNPKINVIEPLWKIITTNKALMAVICEMLPNHPRILKTVFELTEDMKKNSYVVKPITGRQGQNIKIVQVDEKDNENEEEKKIENNGNIYQEYFKLPVYNGYMPILGSWIVRGQPQGFLIRDSRELITEYQSYILPCRVIS
ncbi:hypothetical protein SteCoe_33088 [Stentor coeruleus]|uniref:Glutathionylspermidine synthase pre-ATP-grasp-like domain-containing protein n=1 Tax=Stentor coeruleus TaxID=5963 RepID=A0A1R2AXQ1_9CILI|nr:hypothetical protein SteCoe_33088 [Stentor coeruleus]